MRRLLILIMALCSLAVMAQQRYFQIEVRHPAAVKLPEAIDTAVHTVLLVNNCVAQPDDFGHQNKRNDVSIAASSVDLSDAARQCLFGLEEALFGQEIWDEVGLLEVSQNKGGNYYTRKQMSRGVADSLCLNYSVDAVLALNQLALYDMRESYITDNDTYYAYLTAYCSAQWAIRPYGSQQVYTFTTADTLTWAAEENDEATALIQLPDRQTALLDFAYYAGERLAAKLTPQWVAEDRYLYMAKEPGFETGMEAFCHQQWEQAASEWQKVYENAAVDKMSRAYAAANVAVACEMQEGFRVAIAYVDASIKILSKMTSSATALQQIANLQYYRKQLEQRNNYKWE